jgi:hypothetical protein
MSWTQVYSITLPLLLSPKPKIVINNNFTGRHLIVQCESLGASPSWYRAGLLAIIINDVTIGNATIEKYKCRLGHTYIQLDDWLVNNDFSFEFQPVPWLVNIQIKIWSRESFNTDIEQLQDELRQVIDELRNEQP